MLCTQLRESLENRQQQQTLKDKDRTEAAKNSDNE